MTRSSLSRNAEKMRPHWVEWLTGLVATLLVLATIGWLVFEAISTMNAPRVLGSGTHHRARPVRMARDGGGPQPGRSGGGGRVGQG